MKTAAYKFNKNTRAINDLFRQFYKLDSSVDAMVNVTIFVTLAQKYLRSMRQQIKLMSGDHDTRTGYQTYGYRSYESIIGNLDYISDRYNCRFRLQWLLTLCEDFDTISAQLDQPVTNLKTASGYKYRARYIAW